MERELLLRASSGLRLALVRGTGNWAQAAGGSSARRGNTPTGSEPVVCATRPSTKDRVFGPNMPKWCCRSSIRRRNHVHTANLPRQGEFVRQLVVDSINQSTSVVGPLHAGEKTLNTAVRKVTRYRKGSVCCTGGHRKKSSPLWATKDACRSTTIKSLRDTFE